MFERLFGRRERGLPRASNNSVQNITLEQIGDIWRGSVNGGEFSVTDRSTLGIPTAYRCVSIVSGLISQFPFDLVRKVDENTREPISNHPVALAISRRPTKWCSPYQFRKLMQTNLLLHGNAYAVRFRTGQRVELEPVSPIYVTPEFDEAAREIRYRYKPPNRKEKLYSASEMFHLKGLSNDGIVGVSPVSQLRKTFEQMLQSQAARTALFKQGNFAGYALKVSGRVDAETRKAIRAEVAAQGGVQNVGNPPLLDETMSIETLGMSAQDAEFMAAVGFSLREIARIYGVPSHLLNDTEKNTSWGEGIEALSRGLVIYTLMDWVKVWEDAIEFQLLSEEPNLQAKFKVEALLRGDQKTQAEVEKTNIEYGVRSRNEVRADHDLPPYEGGDEFLTPLNMSDRSVNEDEETSSDENS